MWANSTLICFTQVFDETRKANVYDLHSDAIEWGVLSVIRLNEDDTTSSSRIFIKILFQVQNISTVMVEICMVPLTGAGRVHGSCKAGGANAGRNVANVLGGTSSKG